jgi:hypothetical protein
MYYVPLPKTHTIERPGVNDTWQVVVTNGAKFTTGLLGEGIYVFGTPRDAAYFANLNSVGHIFICETFLGRTLKVRRPVRGITAGKLNQSGYYSAFLLNSGIEALPQADVAFESLLLEAAEAPNEPMAKNSELGFYAVYNPDQVMPHYVLEVNSSGLPRNVDALLNHPTFGDNEATAMVRFDRVDDPNVPLYEPDLMQSLKNSLEPKYKVDAVFRIHNPILKQRMFTAIHDFELQQRRFKRPSGQNVVFKFHGSPACLSIVRNGFNIATRPGMFGKAIYFAEDPRKSCKFAPTGELLLCRVALGRTLTMRVADNSLNGEGLRKRGYDSVTAPGHRFMCCCYAVNRTEYAIFDPDLAYPEYLIQFTKVIQKKPFRSLLCGDVLLYAIHSSLQALWATLFITMLLMVMYIFLVGITMVISNPTGCDRTVSDRSAHFTWVMAFTIAFVCELLPISMFCCMRWARPVQTHFGLQAVASSDLEARLIPDAVNETDNPPSEPQEAGGCVTGKTPRKILRHLNCWIVFWHVLALALCAVILCINQLIQCPIYTLTDYPVYTVNPINLQSIDVTSNNFVRLEDPFNTSGVNATWQIDLNHIQMYTTTVRTYCLSPMSWGASGVNPQCAIPFIALSACTSASDFVTQLQQASAAHGSLEAFPGAMSLPPRPMIQFSDTSLSPSSLVTSWDSFQYLINDPDFANINTFIAGRAATPLLAAHYADYTTAVATMGTPATSWPLCGAYEVEVIANNTETYTPGPAVPSVVNDPLTVVTNTNINNGTQSLQLTLTLTLHNAGPPAVYFNDSDLVIYDLPTIRTGSQILTTNTTTVTNNTLVNGTLVNASNTNYSAFTTTNNNTLVSPQILLDFTRSYPTWQQKYTLVYWPLLVPLLFGVALFLVCLLWLGWLYWRHPSEERLQYGNYNKKRKFKAPHTPASLSLDAHAFNTELRSPNDNDTVPRLPCFPSSPLNPNSAPPAPHPSPSPRNPFGP